MTTRSTAITALATALGQISIGNGYSCDPSNVFTESIDPQSYQGDFPVIAIDGSGTEDYDDRQAARFLTRLLEVEVALWDRVPDPDANIDAHADALLLDLEKAINADWTLGGACLRCMLKRNQVLTHKGRQTCAVLLIVEIQYRTSFQSPT